MLGSRKSMAKESYEQVTLDWKTENSKLDHMTKENLRSRIREIKRAIAGGNSGESGSGWNYLCNGKMSGGCVVFAWVGGTVKWKNK